jgi:hypothetical protein
MGWLYIASIPMWCKQEQFGEPEELASLSKYQHL